MKVVVLTVPDAEAHLVEKLLAALSGTASPISVTLEQPTISSFPGLEIHHQEQEVYCNGVLIRLSHYEFFTLCYLAEHPGWVFSQAQIYEAVWKEPGECCGASVTSVISQLRRKLWPQNPRGGYIHTVMNSGYKFDPFL